MTICKQHVLTVVLLFSFCTSSYGYTTKLLSEIPLQDKVSSIAFDTATDTAAALSVTGRSISIINTRSSSVTNYIALSTEPSAISIHVASTTAIVATKSGSLLFYDLGSGELANDVEVGTAVYSVAVDQMRDLALVGVDGGIKVFDLRAGAFTSKVEFGGKATQITCGNSADFVVSKNDNETKLRAIAPTTWAVVAEAPLPGEALSIGADEQLKYVLVTLTQVPGVQIFDMVGLKPLDGIKTDKLLQIVSVNPSTHVAAFADTADGSFTIADLSTRQVVESMKLYGETSALYLDYCRNRLLVTHDLNLMVVQLENPVPFITGLVPWQRAAGEDSFLLAITGDKFIKDSRTHFKDGDYPSLFESNEIIKAQIPAEQLMIPGEVPVTVVNPPPGGGTSNELKFTVLTPAPHLSSISPVQVAVGGAPFTLRAQGKNFLPAANISFNGTSLATNFISSTVLEATIDVSKVNSIGSYPVLVNNGKDNFASNSILLQVVSTAEAAAGKMTADAPLGNQGAGSLSGTILNTRKMPVAGVTVTSKGVSARTDANGNFVLLNLPAGRRTVLIDGSTAEEPGGHYPTIPISVDIEAGRDNPMPFTPYLHRQKSYNFKNIDPATDTVLTDPEIPGFELRIPKGVKIVGWDGKTNLKVSVRTVAPDRLPLKPLPKYAFARTVYMFYFNKVGGGKPDQPIPVKAPNDLGLLPGQKAILYYYDESPTEGEAPNDWAIAGTGTVTPDGKFIVTDPGVGIPKFCCGATSFVINALKYPSTSKDPNGLVNDPVDVANGYFLHERTEYKVDGLIPIEIKRYYRSGDGTEGPFGIGTYFGWDWYFADYGSMLTLIMPGNYQYSFAQQTDGTYTNTTDPEYSGDVVSRNGNGILTLKKKNGWSYTFNGPLLDHFQDPSGNTVTFLKQIDGNISTIILPEGKQINMNYAIGALPGARDALTSISGPSGTVTYSYAAGKLDSVQYPDGSYVSYGYDPSGRMSTVRKNGNVVLTNVYNSDDRVVTQTLPDGGVSSFTYSVAGGYVAETDMTAPNGAAYSWRLYDDNGAYKNGYIASSTSPDGTTVNELEPGTNRLKSVTDPLGRKTSYTYDSKGRVLTKTDAIGNLTQYQYNDACSYVTQVTDPLGKITNIAYAFTNGTCHITHAEIRDPLQNLTTVDFNTLGRLTKITDPNNNPTTIAYDSATPFKPATITDALGNTFRYGYDTMGRLTSASNAKGNKTIIGYDSITERINSITDPIGVITALSYDLNGNLLSLIDGKGNETSYSYDDRNRIVRMTDQLNRTESYTYYRSSEITPTTGTNLKTYTDRKGQTTTFNQYDAMNRPKSITFNDSSTIQLTYDAAGRAITINDSLAGIIGHSYNDYGCQNCSGHGVDRISQETTPLGTINYTYDPDGRKSSMTLSGESTVTYGYNDAGRLTSISKLIGSGTRTYSLGYDAGGRRTSLQIPLANGTDYLTTIYGYDIANRITRMLEQGPSATVENLTYAYDPNGNRTSFSRLAPHPMSPPVASTNHDAANEMLALDAKNFTYDANGNLQTRTDVCGTTTYTWDARNHLAGISGFKPDCTALAASFSYDAFGRRIAKTINGTTTQFVYDGWDISQEIRNGVKTNYVRSLYIDEPLTRITGTSIRHYTQDALGSAIALTDDAGQTSSVYLYDPFGNTATTGETSDNAFQFTGREWDTETGLYYYRARYYAPMEGRFISKDPLGFAGGDVNLYAYSHNNVINRRDPYGLSDLDFDRQSGTLTVYDRNGNQIAQFPAANNTTSTSNGPWPNGTYNFSYYKSHPESGPTGPYGSHGIFIFDVPGRPGIGVHSGRRGPKSKTLGCVRTTDDATDYLVTLHPTDPVETITIH